MSFAIYVPHTVAAMPLEELASRLAASVPDPDAADQESFAQSILDALGAEVQAGRIAARHPLTRLLVQPGTHGAVVLVDDAARFLRESGSAFRICRNPEALPFVAMPSAELVPLADVPHIVAQAMHPETDPDSGEIQAADLTFYAVKQRIDQAALFGELAMVNPADKTALSFVTPYACATAGDLCAFFGETGSCTKNAPSSDAQICAPQPSAAGTYTSQTRWTPQAVQELAERVSKATRWADVTEHYSLTRTRLQEVLKKHGLEHVSLNSSDKASANRLLANPFDGLLLRKGLAPKKRKPA